MYNVTNLLIFYCIRFEKKDIRVVCSTDNFLTVRESPFPYIAYVWKIVKPSNKMKTREADASLSATKKEWTSVGNLEEREN